MSAACLACLFPPPFFRATFELHGPSPSCYLNEPTPCMTHNASPTRAHRKSELRNCFSLCPRHCLIFGDPGLFFSLSCALHSSPSTTLLPCSLLLSSLPSSLNLCPLYLPFSDSTQWHASSWRHLSSVLLSCQRSVLAQAMALFLPQERGKEGGEGGRGKASRFLINQSRISFYLVDGAMDFSLMRGAICWRRCNMRPWWNLHGRSLTTRVRQRCSSSRR